VSAGMSLVFNAFFHLKESLAFMRVPKEFKWTRSSSKSSSKTDCCWGLGPAFHCLVGTCPEQWRLIWPTKKANRRRTEGHQSALLGLHSCG